MINDDILLEIFSFLNRRAELCALRLVSKRCRAVVDPLFFKKVYLDGSKAKPFYDILHRNPNIGRHIQTLFLSLHGPDVLWITLILQDIDACPRLRHVMLRSKTVGLTALVGSHFGHDLSRLVQSSSFRVSVDLDGVLGLCVDVLSPATEVTMSNSTVIDRNDDKILQLGFTSIVIYDALKMNMDVLRRHDLGALQKLVILFDDGATDALDAASLRSFLTAAYMLKELVMDIVKGSLSLSLSFSPSKKKKKNVNRTTVGCPPFFHL